MRIPPLLWLSYFRYLKKNSWLLALCLIAISTGVAVILAIDVASISARRSFDLSTEALTGRTTHQLVVPGGRIPEDLYRFLRVERDLLQCAPVVEGYVSIDYGEGEGTEQQPLVLTLLGVEPLADRSFRTWTGGNFEGFADSGSASLTGLIGSPDQVVLSASTAERLGWSPGESRTARAGGRDHRLTLAGVFRPSSDRSGSALDNIVLVDISTAQVLLDRVGTLDRIDLFLSEPDQLRNLEGLPVNVVIQDAGQSRETAAQLSAAFHTNLRALSYLCLLVAGFLILNVVSFSIAHRRRSLGRLRILGVTSSQLTRLLLGEALILGLVGSLFGLLFGLALGRALVPLVTQTLNDLYYVHSITGFEIELRLLLKAFCWGLTTTLLAALWPAFDAAKCEPLLLLHRVETAERNFQLAVRLACFGLVLLATSLAVLGHQSLTAGLFSLLLMVLGSTLLVPFGLVLFVKLGTLAARSLSTRMAWRGLSAYLERTGLAAVALTVAVAATVSIGMMVHSFRGTLTVWLETTLVADIYVGVRDLASFGSSSGVAMEPDTVEAILSMPGVLDWVGQRVRTVPSSTGETMLVGLRAPKAYREALVFLELSPLAWERFELGEGVFLTEPYARRASLWAGDELSISTPLGERTFEVLGVYYSYAPDRNLALAHGRAVSQLFAESNWSGLALYLDPDQDPSEVVEELKRRYGEALEVRSTGELKRLALEIFERTFTVTEVLRLLALGVAFVGIFLSLLALALERTSEVRVLRVLGFETRQLFSLSVLQSGLLGLISGFLALPLGVALAQVMIQVINRRAFGWTITPVFDGSGSLVSLLLAVLAAGLAGLYPARFWSRLDQGESLRERE